MTILTFLCTFFAVGSFSLIVGTIFTVAKRKQENRSQKEMTVNDTRYALIWAWIVAVILAAFLAL